MDKRYSNIGEMPDHAINDGQAGGSVLTKVAVKSIDDRASNKQGYVVKDGKANAVDVVRSPVGCWDDGLSNGDLRCCQRGQLDLQCYAGNKISVTVQCAGRLTVKASVGELLELIIHSATSEPYMYGSPDCVRGLTVDYGVLVTSVKKTKKRLQEN